MPTETIIEQIERFFAERGAEEYHGETVSQLEHALQCAALGETQGASRELIVAALLHDIGHLIHRHGENAAAHGIDDCHENLGQRLLAQHFGPAITEPIRLHVAAKRYLCAVEPEYLTQLSAASRRSLELQGGPMTPNEVLRFEQHEHFREALDLRRWDDQAKVCGTPTPSFQHYREYLRKSLRDPSV